MATDKLKLLRRFSIIPIGTLVLGFIFPFGTAMAQFFGMEALPRGCICSPNIVPVAKFLLISLILWFVCAIPIFYGPIKDAIYVKIVMLFGGLLMLQLFPTGALYMVSCKRLASVGDIAFVAIIVSCLLSAITIYLMRKRYALVIDTNKHVFDFENKRWSLTLPLIHISGKYSTKNIAALSLSASFIGVILIKFLPFELQDWGGFIFLWTITWIVFFFYGGGELYTIWIVWRRCRKEGIRMQTAELLNGR